MQKRELLIVGIVLPGDASSRSQMSYYNCKDEKEYYHTASLVISFLNRDETK